MTFGTKLYNRPMLKKSSEVNLADSKIRRNLSGLNYLNVDSTDTKTDNTHTNSDRRKKTASKICFAHMRSQINLLEKWKFSNASACGVLALSLLLRTFSEKELLRQSEAEAIEILENDLFRDESRRAFKSLVSEILKRQSLSSPKFHDYLSQKRQQIAQGFSAPAVQRQFTERLLEIKRLLYQSYKQNQKPLQDSLDDSQSNWFSHMYSVNNKMAPSTGAIPNSSMNSFRYPYNDGVVGGDKEASVDSFDMARPEIGLKKFSLLDIQKIIKKEMNKHQLQDFDSFN